MYSQLTFFNFFRTNKQCSSSNSSRRKAAAAAESAIDANTTYVFFLMFVHVAVEKQKQEKMPKARSNIYVGPGMLLKKKILYTFEACGERNTALQ